MTLPNVCEAVDTSYGGRGLQSREDIQEGSLILTAQPYTHVIPRGISISSLHCDVCFIPRQGLQRCSGCKILRYCGRSCQRRDWQLHKSECKAFAAIAPHAPSDTMRLVLRLLTLRSHDPQHWLVEQLCSHEGGLPTAVSEELVLQVAGVLRLAPGTDAQLVHSTCCKVLCNAFSICDHEQNSIGIGIYLPASLLNHSCLPNCAAVFEDGSLLLRSLQHIPSGCELLISYTEVLQPVAVRQAQLERVYGFHCVCSRCRDEQLQTPPYHSLYSGCRGVSPSDVEKAMGRALHSLEEIKSLATRNEWQRVETLCLRELEGASPHLPPGNIAVLQLREQLLQSLLELGRWSAALSEAAALSLPYRCLSVCLSVCRCSHVMCHSPSPAGSSCTSTVRLSLCTG